MEIGAAQVEIAAPGGEQRRRDAVDEDAGAGDRHDDSARHRLRIAEAAQGLPRQRADGDEQQRGVEQRGENRRAAQAVAEPRRRRAPGQHGGEPGDRQRQNVAEIVAGVGQQRDRMGENAARNFGDDEAGVERDADGERPAEIGGAWRVAMAVTVAMIMIVIVG